MYTLLLLLTLIISRWHYTGFSLMNPSPGWASYYYCNTNFSTQGPGMKYSILSKINWSEILVQTDEVGDQVSCGYNAKSLNFINSHKLVYNVWHPDVSNHNQIILMLLASINRQLAIPQVTWLPPLPPPGVSNNISSESTHWIHSKLHLYSGGGSPYQSC